MSIFSIDPIIASNSTIEVDLLVILVMCLISFCLAKLTPTLPCAFHLIFPGEISLDISLFAAAWTNLSHGNVHLSILKTKKLTP